MGDANKNINTDGSGKMTLGTDKVQDKVEELLATKDQSKIFGRRSSVMRSPPLRERASSTGDLSKHKQDEIGKKRKVHDTSMEMEVQETSKRRENPTTAIVKDLLAVIAKHSQALDKLVEDNPNTKKEIKEIIGKLRRNMDTFKKPSIQKWLEDRRWEETPKQTSQVSVQTDCIESPGKTDMGTQTYNSGDSTGEEVAKSIWNKIERAIDYEEWHEIIKEEWPEEAFKITEIAGERVKWSSVKEDLVLVLTVGDEESGLARAARSACPVACALLDEGLEAGKVVYGSISTSVSNREEVGETQRGIRHTYILPVSKDKTLQGEEVYEGMKVCNSIILRMGRKSINLAVQDGVDSDMIRNMAEGVLGKGTENIKFFLPFGENKKGKNEGVRRRGENKPSTEKPRRERQTEAITVCQEGKTYSDMLRLIKNKVKTNSVAAQGIRTIRESREGKMVIVMEKKEREAIEELKGELRSLQNVKMRVSGGRDISILLIKDMDGLTTKKDIEEAVCKELGMGECNCEIGDLRPYYGGNQAVTMKIAREQAEPLIRKGKIKIGLSWCSISEKVNVTQCYRCWQFGHISVNCNEREDLTEACRKCGGMGHKAALCQNRDSCLSCKREGHGAGSGKCPLFRQALRRARLNKKRKEAY